MLVVVVVVVVITPFETNYLSFPQFQIVLDFRYFLLLDSAFSHFVLGFSLQLHGTLLQSILVSANAKALFMQCRLFSLNVDDQLPLLSQKRLFGLLQVHLETKVDTRQVKLSEMLDNLSYN